MEKPKKNIKISAKKVLQKMSIAELKLFAEKLSKKINENQDGEKQRKEDF